MRNSRVWKAKQHVDKEAHVGLNRWLQNTEDTVNGSLLVGAEIKVAG